MASDVQWVLVLLNVEKASEFFRFVVAICLPVSEVRSFREQCDDPFQHSVHFGTSRLHTQILSDITVLALCTNFLH